MSQRGAVRHRAYYPQRSARAERAEALGAGEGAEIGPGAYAVAIDARQRAYLRTLLRRSFPQRRPVQHDFACGSGRAIRLLHGAVRMAHGYDPSPAAMRYALCPPGGYWTRPLAHEIDDLASRYGALAGLCTTVLYMARRIRRRRRAR